MGGFLSRLFGRRAPTPSVAAVGESEPSTIEPPDVVVHGVVSPSGASVSRGGAGTPWWLWVSLSPWRRDGAALQDGTLQLGRTGDYEDLCALQDAIEADAAFAFVAADPAGDPPGRMQLRAVSGRVDDADLLEVIRQRAIPVIHVDPLFGELTLDRRFGSYAGRASWRGHEVRLDLSADDDGSPLPALAVAHRLWQDADAWQQRLEARVPVHLLPLKNGPWLEDDEEPLSAADFIARMTLKTVAAHPDGSFDFWHDDGGLFAGHAIMLAGDLESGFTDDDIPG